MSASAHGDKRLATAKADVRKAPEAPIPEMIEDRRKDQDGKMQLHGKYNRGKLLGKGGFAKCFVGTTLSGRLVALKIVDKESLTKAKAKAKLQSEIFIHRDLRHQHIVKFEKFFEDSRHVYIILELCNNNSMSELMKRRKVLSEPEVRYYVNQVVTGIQFLHSNLVIHRDLKLGNLFIDHDMKIKIGDFGLATKLSTPDERKKTLCGTPNYIAPEILKGKNGHSFEVDIWSLGVLIYTLLFGKPPFEDVDVNATYERILNNNFSYPQGSTVCESAKFLITSMLQHRPENRPALDSVPGHAFFAYPYYTPSSLPSSSLRAPPSLPNEVKSLSMNSFGSGTKPNGADTFNKENDFNAINLMPPAQPTAVVALDTKPARAVSVPNVVRRTNSRGLEDAVGGGIGGAAVKPTKPQGFEIFSDKPIESARPVRPVTTSVVPPFFAANSSSSGALNMDICEATNSSSSKGNMMDVEEDNRSELRNSNMMQVENSRRLSGSAFMPKMAWSEGTEAPPSRSSVMEFEKKAVLEVKPSSLVSALPESVYQSPPAKDLPNRLLKEPNTLEAMHDTLHFKFAEPDGRSSGFNMWTDDQPVATKLTFESSKKSTGSSPVWVIRYVDYTSKYGLGFLLNNGVAGVYFNDNTKIVLSSDGLIFQYIEKRRRLSSGGSMNASNSGENVVQTHTMASYPNELQKKVTLLRHFRSYLLEQQRLYGEGSEAQAPESNGFPASVSTGTSANDAMARLVVDTSKADANDENYSIPFLKKWVKTRHAILFRLSNKSVQVVFFDRSTILLTAEAHSITYVSKEGQRSEHSLQEALRSGRADIIKRLKYAKDIMYRLINFQTGSN